MRFATRVLVLQLLTVVAVVGACAAVFVFLTVDHLRAEAKSSALAIARTVAAEPEVRREVGRATDSTERRSAQELAEGPLQLIAADAAERADALFVVVTDADGIRLAHPEPDRLNERVSTSHEAALRGEEVTAWETGTLGESARAKVPVFAPGTQTPVGEVSVGFERASVFDSLPRLLLGVAVAAGMAVTLGAAATLWLRRRWEQLTLGVQPEELVALVQNHTAVLDGVGDGVVALDLDGVVRVCNDEATRMLGTGPLTGMTLAEVDLPDEAHDALQAGEGGVVVGDRILYVDARPVHRGGQRLGSVIVLRDRTDVVALSERLDSVRAMTSALRVQRHEFANSMHVAAGLVDAGRLEEASEFLRGMRDHGPVDYPLAGGDPLTEPFLRSFLGAKSIEATERGVRLRVSEDTLVLGTVTAVEDVATVLGNLVDNAVTAAASGDAPRGVEVTLLDEADTLVLVIADTGAGIAPGADVFAKTSGGGDTIHGHGIGLKLSRELTRRRGGDLWVIDRGGSSLGRGAVMGARIPGVMDNRGEEDAL